MTGLVHLAALVAFAADPTPEQLVRDLGSPLYAVREKATRELWKLGEKARPALAAAVEERRRRGRPAGARHPRQVRLGHLPRHAGRSASADPRVPQRHPRKATRCRFRAPETRRAGAPGPAVAAGEGPAAGKPGRGVRPPHVVAAAGSAGAARCREARPGRGAARAECTRPVGRGADRLRGVSAPAWPGEAGGAEAGKGQGRWRPARRGGGQGAGIRLPSGRRDGKAKAVARALDEAGKLPAVERFGGSPPNLYESLLEDLGAWGELADRPVPPGQ